MAHRARVSASFALLLAAANNQTTLFKNRVLCGHAGELSALEDVIALLIRHQPQPLLKPMVLKALWWLCERAHQAALAQACARPLKHFALYITCCVHANQAVSTIANECQTTFQAQPGAVPLFLLLCIEAAQSSSD